MFGEAGAGGEQPIQLAGLLQLIEPAKRGEHALANPVALAEVLDDLQILAGAGLFDAEEHGDLGIKGHHNSSDSIHDCKGNIQ